MPGRKHKLITELTVRLLPDWQKAMISAEAKNLIREYCLLPDAYFDLKNGGHEKAAPYYFETAGIPFHHVPDTPIAPLYRYWATDKRAGKLRRLHRYMNLHWQHSSDGYLHYISRSLEALLAGNVKDGCAYAGWLLHVLQECGFGAGSLEGFNGTDRFVLQRLFPETTDLQRDPLAILSRPSPPPSASHIGRYVFRLLGYEPAEMTFHLYTRQAAVTSEARRLCHQIVVNVHEGRPEANPPLFAAMYRNAACLCADLLYSLLCVAAGRCDTKTSHLMEVVLSDMEPIERPWMLSAPYGHRAVVRNHAFDVGGRRIPLQLMLQPGARPVTFSRGLAMGSHYRYSLAYDLPRDLYQSLDCVLGLHAKYVWQGKAALSLHVDGKPAYAAVFSREHPAERVRVDRPGGHLELRVEADIGDKALYNHIVWAEPVLRRKAPAPQ